jgi:uncharacterized protein
MGASVALNVMNVIQNAPNVLFVHRYLRWQIISIDPDDNKFIDCAIAANARCIVSHDKHFNILSNIPFPYVTVLSVAAFKQFLFDVAE